MHYDTYRGHWGDPNRLDAFLQAYAVERAKIEARKVLYRSNRGSKNESRLDFGGEIPMWPGNNMVTVVARENDDVRSSYTFYVHRTGGQTEQAAANAPAKPSKQPNQ